MRKLYLLLCAFFTYFISLGQTLPVLPLDFESATTTYTFNDFGGGVATVIANPQSNGINTSAKVGKMVKGAPEVYGGSFISLASPIDFAAGKIFKVKVFMPRAGAKLLLKVENQTDGSINFEKEATGTVANAWEELSFDYSAINTANQFQKIVLIFDLGTAGDGSANFTYLFDDIRLTSAVVPPGLTQMNLPVTFDLTTVNYGLVGFGGADVSTIVTDPTLASNKVAKVIKSAVAELWAGTSVTAVAGGVQTGFSAKIPFTAADKKMTVRVWSPNAGIKVRLKVEDHLDPTKSVETEATSTVASAWETLTFDFGAPAAGTAALNLVFNYNKVSIFFNFGVTGAVAGEKIYYFDDVQFGGSITPPPPTGNDPVLPLDFESATTTYAFNDFGGGVATVIANPQSNGINTSAKVGKMVKGAPEVYGGSFISLASPIDFAAGKIFKVKVFMPRAGAKLLLKVENQTDGSINFEKEATGTVANAWEELSFDYSAINTANQFQKIVLIFDLGTAGDGSANFTYLFDDIRLTSAVVPPGLTQMNLPVTFDLTTVNYGLVGFGGADVSTIVTDPTLASNKVAKVIKSAVAELWAGTSVTAVAGGVQTGFSAKIPFTAADKKMTVRVWSPNAGIKVRLKVEDHLDPTKSVETEATSTVASAWETLTFDFGAPAAGTAALNLVFNYNKVSIFFNFGVTGAVAGEKIYYFDDVKFGIGINPAPPAPTVNTPVTYCQNAAATPLTAVAGTGNNLKWYLDATGGTALSAAPVPATATPGSITYYVGQADATGNEGTRSALEVIVNAAPVIPVVNAAISYCQDAITSALSATGATSNTLLWYTQATGGIGATAAPVPSAAIAGATTFYVSQASAAGCESPRAPITVTVSAFPAASITASPYTALYPGLSTTLILQGAVVPGNTYTWFRNGSPVVGSSQNTLSVDVNGLGNYSLKVTSSAGCERISNIIAVKDSVNSKLFVYPNPSPGQFQVRYHSDANNLTARTMLVYDSKGVTVVNQRFTNFGAFTKMDVVLKNKSTGIYTIILLDANGKRIVTGKVSIVN